MKEKEKTRTDLLNLICEIRKPENYLEIGIQRGVNFKEVNCPVKCGVDPAPHEPAHEDVLRMTSNEFFYTKNPDDKYDLIFIDGSHEATQVYEDIVNAIQCLKPGGIIVGHDALPATEMHTGPEWCGDAYRAYYSISLLTGGICTWRGDHGCWILYPEGGFDGDLSEFTDISYPEFMQNCGLIMNTQDWEGVKSWLKNLS